MHTGVELRPSTVDVITQQNKNVITQQNKNCRNAHEYACVCRIALRCTAWTAMFSIAWLQDGMTRRRGVQKVESPPRLLRMIDLKIYEQCGGQLDHESSTFRILLDLPLAAAVSCLRSFLMVLTRQRPMNPRIIRCTTRRALYSRKYR